jgi:hypothetical protein
VEYIINKDKGVFMKFNNLIKAVPIFFAFMLISFAFFSGCNKNNSTVTSPTTQDPQATSDAATSLGGAMAINNGGVLDQMQDLLNTPTNTGILNKSIISDPNFTSSVTFSYDSTTGWWTVNVDRTRQGLLFSAHYTREYMHQFLDKNGVFQKRYITLTGDTAYTVHHKIVGGTGQFNNIWLSHVLTGLSCEWTATNTNTPTVTINTTSPYTRSAIDTIFGAGGGVRTLNHTITVNFVNVIGPRGTGLNWYAKTSGTLTGHYHAVVTFTKGTAYSEHTIDRDFSITLGGTKVIIVVGGTTFQADPNTGQI